MILVDERGPIEVDGKMLVELLHDVYSMGLATAIEQLNGRHDKQTVKMVNYVLKETWGNDAWKDRFMDHIFKVCRDFQESRNKDA